MESTDVIKTLEHQLDTVVGLNHNYEKMIYAQEQLIQQLNKVIEDYENQLQFYWDKEQ